MKIVFQRVKNASLKINGTLISRIDNGIMLVSAKATTKHV